MAAEQESVYVSSVLDPELVRQLDLKIAEARVRVLRAGDEDSVIPTRSGWIRAAIQHYLRCPHRNGSSPPPNVAATASGK